LVCNVPLAVVPAAKRLWITKGKNNNYPCIV